MDHRAIRPKKMARINCMKFFLYNMEYKNKLPDEELFPDPEIIISGIDELHHMEENLMQPGKLHGEKKVEISPPYCKR